MRNLVINTLNRITGTAQGTIDSYMIDLTTVKPEIIVNLCDGHRGKANQASIKSAITAALNEQGFDKFKVKFE